MYIGRPMNRPDRPVLWPACWRTRRERPVSLACNFAGAAAGISVVKNSVVSTKKSGGSLRFCVVYRRLNDLTYTDCFPLPRFDTCLEALAPRWTGGAVSAGCHQPQGCRQDSFRYMTRPISFLCVKFQLSQFSHYIPTLDDHSVSGPTLGYTSDLRWRYKCHRNEFQGVCSKCGTGAAALTVRRSQLEANKMLTFQERVTFLM